MTDRYPVFARSAYLKQQEAEIAAFKKEESLVLPPDLDYSEMASLSIEERQKLAAARPTTLGNPLPSPPISHFVSCVCVCVCAVVSSVLCVVCVVCVVSCVLNLPPLPTNTGAASRIPGMTPNALLFLTRHAKRSALLSPASPQLS
jgi:hypothetical protein